MEATRRRSRRAGGWGQTPHRPLLRRRDRPVADSGRREPAGSHTCHASVANLLREPMRGLTPGRSAGRLAPPRGRRDHCAMAVVAGHELLEREEVLDALGGALADAVAGSGRLVLVAGESGVGKTAAVRAFADASCRRRPVHWGACDPLSTPVPLAPFLDLAAGSLPSLAAALAGPVHRLRRVRGASGRAGRRARRCSSSRTCTGPTRRRSTSFGSSAGGSRPCRSSSWPPTATSRPGGWIRSGWRWATSPARTASSGSPSSRSRRTLCARSPAGRGVDPEELVRRTGGNPFYVTEVLEAGDERVPRDGPRRGALAGRAARTRCPRRARRRRLLAAGGGGVADRRGRRRARRLGRGIGRGGDARRGGRRVRVPPRDRPRGGRGRDPGRPPGGAAPADARRR